MQSKGTGTARYLVGLATLPGVVSGPMQRFEEVVLGVLSDLQLQLRAGAEALTSGKPWAPFARAAAPRWQMVVEDDGPLVGMYAGDWMQTSIAGAADLLLQWWPQLKPCERRRCCEPAGKTSAGDAGQPDAVGLWATTGAI